MFKLRSADGILLRSCNVARFPDLARVHHRSGAWIWQSAEQTEERDLVATAFQHHAKIILQAEQLGGWQPVSEFDLLHPVFVKTARRSERKLATSEKSL